MCAEGTSECRQQGETILVAGVQRSRNHCAGRGLGRVSGKVAGEESNTGRLEDGTVGQKDSSFALSPETWGWISAPYLSVCAASCSGDAAVEEHGPEWQPSHVIFQLKTSS